MSAILAIDPGPTRCAFLVLGDGQPELRGIDATDAVVRLVRDVSPGLAVVIETIEPWHGVARPDALETMRSVGRLQEAAHRAPSVSLLRRSDVLRALGITGLPRGRAQAACRLALIDRWGGGNPARRDHPLHGIHDDLWSALALAVVRHEGLL